ncbi:MAG: hypothetical protein OSA99_00880 [Acidimicrobiales bacterium]|nr:hypothetical protein [Acidimicrobiales bacterium]
MLQRRMLVALLSLALVVVACGGDGDDSETLRATTTTAAAEATTTTAALDTSTRATKDRPDDDPGVPKVHVLYLTPSDGPDDRLDTDGTIAGSMESAMRWLESQIDRRLRLDTFQGELDVTFHRLPRTADEYFAEGVFIRDAIEDDIIAAGFDAPLTVYAAYYAGPSEDCASSFNPETLPGTLVARYWAHVDPGEAPCVPNDFRAAGEPPSTWEFGVTHELFHAMGAVETCAPNHFEGHVGDHPDDLMYRGDQPWKPDSIDIGNDDYYGHGDLDCTDVARAPYWAS